MQKSKLFKSLKREVQKNTVFNQPAEPEQIPLLCESLASLIKTMRLTRGWTQAELAQLLNISRQHLQKWEYGLIKPNQKHLRDLLMILKYKTAETVIRRFYV